MNVVPAEPPSLSTPAPLREELAFRVFGPDHLAVLALVVLGTAAMIATARRKPTSGLVRGQEVVFGILLLVKFPVGVGIGWSIGLLEKEAWLPVHLCDLAAFTGGFALLTRERLCAELTYFWGMAGTLNGLLTPTVQYAFPHPAFFVFFWLHAGVVAAAIYLVVGASLWPRPGAVWRSAAWTFGYMVIAIIVNSLLGTNYGFLAEPPPTSSLLDLVRDWPKPFYLGFFIALGLLLYALLYSPFYLLRKIREHKDLTSQTFP